MARALIALLMISLVILAVLYAVSVLIRQFQGDVASGREVAQQGGLGRVIATVLTLAITFLTSINALGAD